MAKAVPDEDILSVLKEIRTLLAYKIAPNGGHTPWMLQTGIQTMPTEAVHRSASTIVVNSLLDDAQPAKAGVLALIAAKGA